MYTKMTTVVNATGLHARPASDFVRAAAVQGIHVVLDSGRPLALMRETAAELGCVRYAISANGVCDDLTAAVAGQPVGKFNVDGLSHSLRDAVLARLEPLRGDLGDVSGCR